MPYGNDYGYGGGQGYGYGGGRGQWGDGGRRPNKPFVPRDPEDETFRKLFIGGLSYETTEESLKAHFEQWGTLTDCVIMKDPNTKRSRGFGFITYKCASMVDEAQSHRPHKIDGRQVESKRAMPKDEQATGERQQSVTKIFIGGIKDNTTEDQIRETFQEFGNIEAINLVSDKQTGKLKGFAFVSFDDYDCVDKAVLRRRFDLNGKQVEVKKALPKPGQEPMMGGGRGGGRRGGGGYGGGGSGGYGGYGDGYGGYDQGGYGSGGYNQGYGGGGSWGGQGGGYDNYGGGYGNQGGWGGNSGGYGGYGDGGYGGGAIKGGGYSGGRGGYGGGGRY